MVDLQSELVNLSTGTFSSADHTQALAGATSPDHLPIEVVA